MQEPTAHFLPDVAVHGGVGYADTRLWVPLGRAVPSDTSLPGTETQKGLTLSRGCSFLALPRAVNLRKAARLFPEVAGMASWTRCQPVEYGTALKDEVLACSGERWGRTESRRTEHPHQSGAFFCGLSLGAPFPVPGIVAQVLRNGLTACNRGPQVGWLKPQNWPHCLEARHMRLGCPLQGSGGGSCLPLPASGGSAAPGLVADPPQSLSLLSPGLLAWV